MTVTFSTRAAVFRVRVGSSLDRSTSSRRNRPQRR
jgi:hypothetical protein